MPHTKSDHNIQVRLRLVQKLCLQDWITHIHTDTFAAFRDADRCLLLCSGFAADTIHLKAMSAQDICQDTAFFQQSDTGCDPDLFRINLLCKIHDFFDTGMFAVILILYFSCSDCDFAVLVFIVAFHSFIQNFFIHVCCQTEIRIGFIHFVAVFYCAVDTGHVFFFHFFILLLYTLVSTEACHWQIFQIKLYFVKYPLFTS